jgi:hypothetical protein
LSHEVETAVINPTVGDPLLNVILALLVVAGFVTIASARGRAPLWPAVLLELLAALLELVRRAGS